MKHLKFALLAIFIVIIQFLFVRGIWTFPQYISLGFFQIHFYSIFLLSAFLLVARLFDKYAKQDPQLMRIQIDDALLWTLIPAILLARVWHVATDWHLYADNTVAALFIWQGGLSIFGGLVGGLVGIFLYCRRQKIDFLRSVDLLAIFMPLGQALGRYGNLANQELYGPKTNLPWGMYIRSENAYFHPAFLYEQIGSLILFSLLFTIFKRGKIAIGNGHYLGLYFLGYGIVRFIVDFFRTDPDVVSVFSVGQIVSAVFVLSAAAALLLPNLKARQYRR